MNDDLQHALSVNRVKNMATKFRMENEMDTDSVCEDHSSKFAPKQHPDAKHVPSHAPEHKRGAAPPAHHSKGKMKSQLQPDHGPHR